MKQQIAIITLGVKDICVSKKFYIEGFGWKPVLENTETVLYQMNGFILSTWLQHALEQDIQRSVSKHNGGITLAHNVASRDKVQKILDILDEYGGKILRNADTPPHGGMRGYIADPDNHVWEIIWNPIWHVSKNGYVTYKPKIAEVE